MGELFTQYQFDGYAVRLAAEKDSAIILQLLRHVAVWLEEKGFSQWEHLRSGDENEELRQDIAAGKTYIVENTSGNAVATFNLSQEQNSWDKAMWGERHDNACYLHRLAVNRDHQNKQIGRKLLRWIDNHIVIHDGYLRLDCVAANQRLNDFYQRAGFSFIGYTDVGNDRFSKYEKPVKSKA